MNEKRTNRGRPRLGDDRPPRAVKYSSSLPPEVWERLERYCKDDERDKSYAIRKALEVWLGERGY